METTRILWSGLTGKVGRAAMGASKAREDVEIVSGICRTRMNDVAAIRNTSFEGVKWFRYSDLDFSRLWQFRDIDVIVDFSHPEHYGEMVTLAVMLNKPLVFGTSGLDAMQLMELEHYCYAVPIFYDPDCRFRLRAFIERAAKFAQNHGDLCLDEKLYVGKGAPDQVSKLIAEKIHQETGKSIKASSSELFRHDTKLCEWVMSGSDALGPHKIRCEMQEFSDLACDVLEIAKVMATKPAKTDTFYDLDQIWDDLPHDDSPK